MTRVWIIHLFFINTNYPHIESLALTLSNISSLRHQSHATFFVNELYHAGEGEQWKSADARSFFPAP